MSEEIRYLIECGNTQVEFQRFENFSQRSLVQSLIEEYASFIPPDCRELILCMCPQKDNNCMEVSTVSQYRFAKIFVYPLFFVSAKKEQVETLLHELVHIHHTDIIDWVNRVIFLLIQERNPELHTVLQEEFFTRCEKFTEDFAIALAKNLEPVK